MSSVIGNAQLFIGFTDVFLSRIGGAGEKRFPGLNLDEVSGQGDDPLKPETEGSPDAAGLVEELSRLKNETFLKRDETGSSLKSFTNRAIKAGNLTENILAKILEGLIEIVEPTSETSVQHFELSGEQKLAANLFADYCPKLSREDVEKISRLSLFSGQDSGPDFDWFSAAALRIFGGDFNTCKAFLVKFRPSPGSSFLWPKKLGVGGRLVVAHHVETILLAEDPLLFHKLVGSGVSISVVVDHWLSQVFLNVVDFPEVVNYVGLVAANGPDFVVYFCVAVFSHLREKIVAFRAGAR